jgi:hypothetical protein
MARYSLRELKLLAQKGAEVRIAQLQEEITTLSRHFKIRGTAADRPRRRRPRMSAAARAEVSRRMKAYWSARRREKR